MIKKSIAKGKDTQTNPSGYLKIAIIINFIYRAIHNLII